MFVCQPNPKTMEQLILDKPYARVVYFPERSLAQVTWNGKATREEYIGVFQSIFDFSDKNGIQTDNYLSDIRNQAVVGPEERKWFETVAVPEAVKRGLKRAAVVFDGNVFKKYYLNLILKTTNKFKLPLKFFNDPESAYVWFDNSR